MAITPVGQTSNNVQTDNNVSGVTDAAITQDNGAPIEQYDNGHNCYAYGANRGCPEEGGGCYANAACYSEACVSDTRGGAENCPSHVPICPALEEGSCRSHTGEPNLCAQETPPPDPCSWNSPCQNLD